MRRTRMICQAGVMLFTAASTFAQSDLGIQLADGLTIQLVADDKLVPDCTTVAVGPDGRIVASGPGYIRRMIDRDGDGRFDDFDSLADRPGHGAHGLCFDQNRLYYVGDNGIWMLPYGDDTGHDHVANHQPVRVLEIKTGGEHDAHALRKGPDGSWYLIAGNNTRGMYDLQNVDLPLIPNPRAGAIWRISSDWKKREVWAHGFRNAYDFDFAPDHAIDTFDSDGERDVSLPWYRPTRVYRVRQGNDAGWLSRSWKRPNSDPQMPIVLAELGRGSPTGVVRYRHRRLPARYRDGIFVLDWTFGRVVFVGDDTRFETIAHPTGTAGFAVTDIDALPDGRLVISVGGRRSRGGLYVIDAMNPGDDRAVAVQWPDQAPDRREDETVDWIKRLRNRPIPTIDGQAATHAIGQLDDASTTRDELLAAIVLLIESVGGLGEALDDDPRAEHQRAAVFDGYRSRLRPNLPDDAIETATRALTRIVRQRTDDAELKTEAIRALAVLEPDSSQAFNTLVFEMPSAASPTATLHRLVALARIPAERSDTARRTISDALLEVPVEVERRGMNVDRNWTPRMNELLKALSAHDPGFESNLVSHSHFGHPSHLVWLDALDVESRERARLRFLERFADDAEIDPRVARAIAAADHRLPQTLINRWLQRPTTQAAAFLAIARHPRESDLRQLQDAALSVDPAVRESATAALKRLGAAIPTQTTTSESISQWLQKLDVIGNLEGDAQSGRQLFIVRQCANCHDGAKALGPSLQGISKRFATADLFRATVDPNHTISDRYRAKQVLTTEGVVVTGMPIYESVDGLTLLTADAKTLRINADSIDQVAIAKTSLMPEGLIDGLSDAQVADLIAYMQSL